MNAALNTSSSKTNRWFFASMGVRTVACRRLASGQFEVREEVYGGPVGIARQTKTLSTEEAKAALKADRSQGGEVIFLNATELADRALSSF